MVSEPPHLPAPAARLVPDPELPHATRIPETATFIAPMTSWGCVSMALAVRAAAPRFLILPEDPQAALTLVGLKSWPPLPWRRSPAGPLCPCPWVPSAGVGPPCSHSCDHDKRVAPRLGQPSAAPHPRGTRAGTLPCPSPGIGDRGLRSSCHWPRRDCSLGDIRERLACPHGRRKGS